MFCTALSPHFCEFLLYIISPNIMMSGSKAPDFDAYGLFRATHSHNPLQYSHIEGLSSPGYSQIPQGRILTKFLATPRCTDSAGAYYGKILICAPMSRYRRGVFWQNLLLRPDGTTTTGLILAKSLAAPRWHDNDGAYSGKIPGCAPMARRSVGRILAKSLAAPQCPDNVGAYYAKILICAPMYKGGGYNRPGFVSHTLARKFFRVQIAWIRSQYPRPHKYIKILTGRYLRCPSVFLSVNIYFINDLLQSVCLHILELL